MWFIIFSFDIQYENIPPFEQEFNKVKDKNIAGL